MPGGSAPYKKGARYENKVAGLLRGAGYLAIRPTGSKGARGEEASFDLVAFPLALHSFEIVRLPFLVECKTNGYLRPADKVALIELAERYGCVPVLAGKTPVKFTDLRSGEEIEIEMGSS